MKVCVGGTFNAFHIGHEALLMKCSELGDEIYIGIVIDEFAEKMGKNVKKYKYRKASVTRFMKKLGKKFYILPISHRYGDAVDSDYGAIVVSEETKSVAEEINRIRRKKGKKKLDIHTIDYVLAEDGLPVSSTRIINGEIDRFGKVKNLSICVGSGNPMKVNAVRDVFKRLYKSRRIIIKSHKISTEKEEPINDEILLFAVKRAKEALGTTSSHWGIGIEAGLAWNKRIKGYIDVQYCAIIDRGNRVTIGHGPGFLYPKEIQKRSINSCVGEVMEKITGIKNLGMKGGAIGYLSKGLMSRKKLTESAVIAALLPRISNLYADDDFFHLESFQ